MFKKLCIIKIVFYKIYKEVDKNKCNFSYRNNFS